MNIELKEYIYSKGEPNEIKVYAINKTAAKARIQRIIDARMDKAYRKMASHSQYELDQEQERIDNLDWKTAYYEALEALRVYNPLLADKIDKDMK